MTQIQGPPCCANGICGYGPEHASIMAIGIAPGRHEHEVSHRPLTGPSGKLFDAILETHSISRDNQVYCTNLVCFWKDKPDKTEIAKCHSRLFTEIELINPKVILLLGSLVCETILGMKLAKARGAVIPISGKPHQYYLATNHPAAALHPDNKELQINAAYDLIRDCGKLPLILDGYYESKFITTKPTYELVTTSDRAQQILDNLKAMPIIIDVETSYDKEADKSHPFSDTLTCLGVGHEDNHCWVFTPSALINLNWPIGPQWTFHNGQFDTIQIKRHLDVWLPIKHDTMLQSYSLDERNERGLHRLKHLAREFCGADFYEEDEHDVTQPERLYQYNANDVCYTTRLFYHQEYLQQKESLNDDSQPYRKLLLPLSEILAQAQYRGIYINQENVRHIEAVFGSEYIKLDRELHQLSTNLGYPDLNLRSPTQLKTMLHAQGFNIPNTDKYTLQDLADADNVFVQKLMRHRMLGNLITRYLHEVLEQIKYDGRVHPHAFVIGTVTGRLTYKDPSMNTLPKPKTVKDLGIIRSIFSATNDDYILLEVDYKTIEGWIGAFLSEDDVMWSDLSSSDWHDATTTGLFYKTKEDCLEYEWAHLRDAGKHINYGAMYEEQAQGLTRKPPIGIGCDIVTAQQYLNLWYQRYHKFDLWRRNIKRIAREDAELITPFGRKRRFPIIVNDHQMRQAVNFPIQSTASDYTISSAIRLWHKLEQLDTHLLFIEHDALYYEVLRSNLQQVMELIQYEMTRPPLPGLPSIKVEIDVGSNLAELVRYK